jgi:hypothetical protein
MRPSVVTESPAESRPPKSEHTWLTSHAAMKAPLLSSGKSREVEKAPHAEMGKAQLGRRAVAGQGSRAFTCASDSPCAVWFAAGPDGRGLRR